MSRQYHDQDLLRREQISNRLAGGGSPVFEALEQRMLLSASLVGNLLTLTGTENADSIMVLDGDAKGDVLVYGVDGVADGTLYSNVNNITINALGGDDDVFIGDNVLDLPGVPIGVLVTAAVATTLSPAVKATTTCAAARVWTASSAVTGTIRSMAGTTTMN
ncbi:MAG: LEPR-XLL domain-containing protein [Phycisphaerales bacterium]